VSSNLTWVKSSYSGGQGGNCVEVAVLPGGGRAVRDSKNPHQPALTFTPAEWRAFTAGIRDGAAGRS
jgi:Domain of unknown function (DUF397)